MFSTLAFMGLDIHFVHGLVLYAQSLAEPPAKHTLCWFVVALLHLQSDAGSSTVAAMVLDSWRNPDHLYRNG